MYKIFRIALFVCILLLVAFSIAAHFNYLPDVYGKTIVDNFGLVTGLASIIGLLAFVTPKKIKSTDFEEEGIEKLRSLLEATDELKKLEVNKNRTEQELFDLAQQKKMMEISVKRAGLALFYKDQLTKSTEKIQEKIESDKELKDLITEARNSIQRLDSINEEIQTDPNVELVNDILKMQKYHRNQSVHHQETTTDPIISAFRLLSKIIGF